MNGSENCLLQRHSRLKQAGNFLISYEARWEMESIFWEKLGTASGTRRLSSSLLHPTGDPARVLAFAQSSPDGKTTKTLKRGIQKDREVLVLNTPCAAAHDKLNLACLMGDRRYK